MKTLDLLDSRRPRSSKRKMEASPNILQSLQDWIGENPAAVPRHIKEAVMSASGTSSFLGEGSTGK